ncbi:hypothetical protein Rsub_01970 [Raphidocelis subcapitata]|uniref:Uncharacterized protein n=1 Tax=Raphidocelis subcapitata TaxID=307507 RepID=A0A2V0NP52_9CHLO|nr:hypothetical protein Rsub_01970 [Raphidocelis subcapitata]|eukprot:GBF89398.1 hypothetical protein Rsub_01970 [Raphidocelis subcapitata]
MAGRPLSYQVAGPSRRKHRALETLLLLLAVALRAGALAPKVACDFRDPLCSLRARYAAGCATLGGRAICAGGLDVNAPTYPVQGPELEAIDVASLSPHVLQAAPDAALNTTRYRQQLLAWGDGKLLMVGGQFDDANGSSQKTMSMVVFDLAARGWSLLRQFWQSNQAELIWNWAGIYGDVLHMVMEDFGGIATDPKTGAAAPRPVSDMGRFLYSYNLGEGAGGGAAMGRATLLPALAFLPLPIVAAAEWEPGVLLVWQSARSLAAPDAVADPKQNLPAILPIVHYARKTEGATLPVFKVTLEKPPLAQLPGGSGGQVLAARMAAGGRALWLWSNTTADFEGRPGSVAVSALTLLLLSLQTPPGGEPALALALAGALVAPPPGLSLDSLRTVDLPVAGRVAVSPGDVQSGRIGKLPYVGEVGLIGDLDASNVALLEVDGGLFVRGNSKPHPSCAPPDDAADTGPQWKPFALTVRLPAGPPAPAALAGASASAAGAYAWCAAPAAAAAVAAVQRSNFETRGFRGLHGAGGGRLLLVSPQATSAFGIFPEYVTTVPLFAALVDPAGRSISQLSVAPGPAYRYPRHVAACVTQLSPGGGAGDAVYVEYGGAAGSGVPKVDVLQDVSAMALPAAGSDQKPAASIAPLAGAGALPRRAQAAAACAPGGAVWAFGGLRDAGGADKTEWAPTDDLSEIVLARGGGADGASGLSMRAAPVARPPGAAWPPPRHGAAMVALPGGSGAAAALGAPGGALLLIGGSTGTDPELGPAYVNSNATRSPLLGDAWIFDLAARSWTRLEASGEAPPPMMWHSAAADGQRVLVYGGRTFDSAARAWGSDTALYSLHAPTRAWQRAPVARHARGSALRTEFPNSGVVPLGESVALQFEETLMLTQAPKTLTLRGNGSQIARDFSGAAAALSSGDLVVLSPDGGRLEVEQPLTIAGDLVIAGVAPDLAGGGSPGRRLLEAGAPSGAVTVACAKGAGTALRIMSAGAVLRSLNLTGCASEAVLLLPDPSQPSGRYPEDRPVKLDRVSLTANPGAGLRMGNGTAAALSGCAVERNGGGQGAVVAAAGALLNLTDSRLDRNSNGPAVNFTGVLLSASGCNFTANSARDGAGVWAEFAPPPPALYATEGTGTVVPAGAVVSVAGCRFEGNEAKEAGGGLFAGARVSALISRCAFVRNKAREGGGAAAARDGCLELISDSRFEANAAAALGGALLSRAPLCRDGRMAWDGAAFVNNSAGGDGGGVYVSEAAFRRIQITNSTFEGNAARGAAAAGRGGNGGGLYLGVWSSSVALSGVRLARNAAARGGGGVYAVVLSSQADGNDADGGGEPDLRLSNCTAVGNVASGAAGAGLAAAAPGEGGALRVLGSYASVLVEASTFEANAAGAGGAASFGADRGRVAVRGGSRFVSNAAIAAGGALLVGQGTEADLRGCVFEGNAAGALPAAAGANGTAELAALLAGGGGPAVFGGAAGGGFCCYRCGALRLANCSFVGNFASGFGGGAALLRPGAEAELEGCTFERNSAARPPPAARRRRLLAALSSAAAPAAAAPAGACGAGAGAGAPECAGAGPGGPLGGWAAGIDPANTTGDDGRYPGGGGLYVSLSGPVSLSGCRFDGNTAASGGGMIARTDVCPPGNSSGCLLTFRGAANAFVCNSAEGGGAGGGLLVTAYGPQRVAFSNPACAEAAAAAPGGGAAFRRCLGGGAAACAGGGGGGAQRLLLEEGGGGAPEAAEVDAAPLNAALAPGFGNDLASAAATAHFERLDGLPRPDAPTDAEAAAAPGAPLAARLRLRDAAGRNVTGSISDASMIMQARLLLPDGTPADNVTRAGNISRASNGLADFPSLQIFAPPGSYLLEFAPFAAPAPALRPARLRLTLRGCAAGEARVRGAPADAALRAAAVYEKCEVCRFGTFSVDPDFGACAQCDERTHANCTGVAPVPLPGFWTSHPRSPLVHRCLVAAACGAPAGAPAEAARQAALFEWAWRRRDWSVGRLGEAGEGGAPVYVEYTALQCSRGYQGILCGECAAGFGRRGHRCVACPRHRGVNTLFYCLACAYLATLVALAGFLHARQASKRRRTADAGAAARFGAALERRNGGGVGGDAAAPAGAKPSGGGQAPAGPPAERIPSVDDYGGDYGGYGGYSGYGSDQSGRAAPREAPPGGRRAAGPPREGAPPPRREGAGARGGAADCPPRRTWLQEAFSPTPARAPASQASAADADAADAAAAAAGAQKTPQRRFWASAVLKGLVTHLQLLGLLRGLRIDWPAPVNAALTFFDQTSAATTWVSLDCSMREDGGGGGARRAVKSTIGMLLLPVFGVALGLLYWGAHAAITAALSRRRPALRRYGWGRYYESRVVLTVVLTLFYLYPQVSNAVVSIFSCTVLDADLQPFSGQITAAVARAVAPTGALAAGARGGYWSSDTRLLCRAGQHGWLAAAGGVWMGLFCLGFPAAVAAALWRRRARLDDPDVELRYGFLYDSYAPRYYYWESVVLLQKLLLVVSITLLQRKGATLQVLVSLAVVNVAAAAQITLRPAGCALMDGLQRASLYVLQATLFLLLVSSLDGVATPGTVIAALALAAALNVALVAGFLAALASEARRMLLAASGKGEGPGERLSWADVRATARALAPRPGGGKAAAAAAAGAAPLAPWVGGGGRRGGGRRVGPGAERAQAAVAAPALPPPPPAAAPPPPPPPPPPPQWREEDQRPGPDQV